MSVETVLLAWLNTFVCLLGLYKPPKSAYELTRPRFVIPAIIWMTLIFPVFLHCFLPASADKYWISRQQSGTTAMLYVLASLSAFWIGYLLPLGRRLATPLTSAQMEVRINPRSLRVLTYFIGAIIALAMLLIVGSRLWGGYDSGALRDSPVANFIAKAVQFSIPVLAALVGLSWPVRGERNPLNLLLLIALLFLATLPLMMTFSRGTGLPALLALIAYTFRARKLPVFTGVLVLCWLAIASHGGMYGRGVHGHYAGAGPYIHFVLTESIWSWREAALTFASTGDFFTPLCVSITAEPLSHLGRLPLGQWLFYQVPLPRFLGFAPEWTFDLTYYVGGRGTWGYTCGMFGDTYVHLGFWPGGALFFVVGLFYRFIDQLGFGRSDAAGGARTSTPQDTISIAVAVVLISYFAMIYGVFNTFRSWNMLLSVGLFLILSLFVVRFFVGTQSNEQPLREYAPA